MHQIQINIPFCLSEEITQVFFSCGAFSVAEQRKTRYTTLTALTKNTRPFLQRFDQDLLTIKKYTPRAVRKTIRYMYDKNHAPLTLVCHDAFGDGNHPTTKQCIAFLRKALKNKPASVCDIGTGTGILSLIAARHGITDILAIDYAQTAVARTKQNMRANQLRFQVKRQDIVRQPIARHYDLVIANMNSAILEAAWQNILGAIAPHGTLILSGIGTLWVKDIRQRLATSKYRIRQEKSAADWWSAVCIPPLKGVK